MKVTDLNREQLQLVKGAMIVRSLNRNEHRYQEIDVTFPDDAITDEEAFAYYANTKFVEEDFPQPREDS